MIQLTPYQRENWREVLVSMGIMKVIVNNLTDEELDCMANNVQRMGEQGMSDIHKRLENTEMREILEHEGYVGVRQMKNGQWVGVCKMLYTYGLVIGLDETGYDRRYCYEHLTDAMVAAVCYEGIGDPIGPWIKMKGDLVRGEVMGPGAKEKV